MNSSFRKITQIFTGLLIFSIILCVIVGAQSICCSEDLNSYNQSTRLYNKTDVAASFLPESGCHGLGGQLQPRNCSNEKILNVASGKNCCEIDCCEDANKESFVQPTIVQVDNSDQLTEPFIILKKSIDKKFEADRHPHKILSVPIYILTLSIIC